MKAISSFFLLVLLLSGTSESVAQFRFDYFRVGISGGATNYLGDLDDDFPFKFTKPGFGINGTYRFNPMMQFRMAFFQGWMYGDDASSTNGPRSTRNLSFRSHVRELSAQLVVDFVPTDRRYMFRPPVVPYIFGGIGVFGFNPQAQLNDQWFDLQPLGTEGQFLADPDGRYPDPYNLTQICLPMGAGIRFAIGRRWDLELETGFRKTFTDYLDDVSGYYPDMDELRAANPRAYLLSDRIDRSLHPEGAAIVNGIRGDNTQADWYVYTNISLCYILDWVKCPQFR